MKRKRNYSDGAIHRLVEGSKYRYVDYLMDFPSQFLGAKHRRLLHTPKQILPLACLSESIIAKADGRKADYLGVVQTALLHCCVDKIPTRYKQLLEVFMK